MSQQKDPEAFYAKLKEQLEESTEWPSEYLYKFIVPGDSQKIAEVERVFDDMGAQIETRDSSKGSYTSVSIRLKMESPDAVVQKYKEVGEQVDGVISL